MNSLFFNLFPLAPTGLSKILNHYLILNASFSFSWVFTNPMDPFAANFSIQICCLSCQKFTPSSINKKSNDCCISLPLHWTPLPSLFTGLPSVHRTTRGRGRGHPKCAHCHWDGHWQATCYHLHGFPSGHRSSSRPHAGHSDGPSAPATHQVTASSTPFVGNGAAVSHDTPKAFECPNATINGISQFQNCPPSQPFGQLCWTL